MRLVVTATLLASCGSPPPPPPLFAPTMVRPAATVPDAEVVIAATPEECARACKVERACEGPHAADAEITEPRTCVSCETVDAAIVRCIAAATCDAIASCTPPFVWPYGDDDYWRDELR